MRGKLLKGHFFKQTVDSHMPCHQRILAIDISCCRLHHVLKHDEKLDTPLLEWVSE